MEYVESRSDKLRGRNEFRGKIVNQNQLFQVVRRVNGPPELTEKEKEIKRLQEARDKQEAKRKKVLEFVSKTMEAL